MKCTSREKIKNILKELGLLSFCGSMVHRLNKKDEYFIQMKFYLFNNILTFFPNHKIRISYLKNILKMKIGKSCFIHMGARFEGKITIGNNTVIGRNCVLIGEIIIKNNVSITAETYIFTFSHEVNSPQFVSFNKPVIIDDYVWIGARAIVLPGIHLGKGSVLGAASTATKDIPAFSIFAGAPAKEIGKRSELLEYTLNYSPYFQ
jgi:acetyltransferase-like isoleucine patch superfamily enzyme